MNSARTAIGVLVLALFALASDDALAEDSPAPDATPAAAQSTPPATPQPSPPETATTVPAPPAAAPPVAADASAPLPSLRFTSDSVTAEFFDRIQHAPEFANLSKEAVGSPFELRVYHTYRIDRGAATATGLLGAATLGIIPRVLPGSHSIVYEILVNGVTVSTHRYSTDLTRVQSMWSHDKTSGLGEDGLKWARSTVDLFVKDAAADPKLPALRSEFDYYFGAAKTQ
jgi:hypothetical protein